MEIIRYCVDREGIRIISHHIKELGGTTKIFAVGDYWVDINNKAWFRTPRRIEFRKNDSNSPLIEIFEYNSGEQMFYAMKSGGNMLARFRINGTIPEQI